ncbi:MAG: hypothetical protein NVSMB3_14440 [Acidobacteriaceae bacterium]
MGVRFLEAESMTRCRRCTKPLKERAVSDTFRGMGRRVTVAGIPAIVCAHCGYRAVHADTLDEIEMFVRPMLSGGVGMRLLEIEEVTIDLGHPQYGTGTDISDRPFPEGPVIEVASVPNSFELNRLNLMEPSLVTDESHPVEEVRAA